MTFLNPLVLLGLVAAAIPLIIHLFNFRRPRRVDFSTLVFLKELQKSSMQRVRVKQWLLLALRTLAILCLILTFARPVLRGALSGFVGTRGATSMAIVVDNSPSMSVRDAQGEYLAQAREMAAGILAQMEPGDEVFLLTTGEAGGEPAAYGSQEAVLEALDAIETQPMAGTAAQALRRAAQALETAAHPNRELYLLTDAQRTTLADSLDAALEVPFRTVLLTIGQQAQTNVAVTDVQVQSRIIEEGQPVQLEATLVNYGATRLDDYVASVFLEGERVAQASAKLDPGVPTTVAFTATPSRRGWLGGVVQIEGDAFEADNQRFFTLHVPEQRRLLVVRGDGQRADYVQLAFSPELTQGRAVFDVRTIAETALPATALGAYDAVVLVGPRTLASGEVGALARYVAEGGGLLIFPGEGMQVDDYSALLGQLGAGRMAGLAGQPGGAVMATFDRVDLEHPLFQGMLEGAGGAARLESPEIKQLARYVPGSGVEQTLIALSNGVPFLQEIRHGRGTALLMAVAPDVAWSDLPVRGLFIPLLYRAAYYLSATEAAAGEQLVVGRPGEVRLPGQGEATTLRLVGPEGQELVPEQRSLYGAVLLQVDTEGLTPGVYDVKAGSETVRRVALNLDQRESDLATLPPQEAAERLAAVTGAEVRALQPGRAAGRVLEALRAEQTGVELWNVFLTLALLFLVAEMLVARQWRPETAVA